jgi:GT2 family glycosyltransferase
MGTMARTHVIIVNYNSGDWLTRSLQSACQHSAGLVTVVDNNSLDDSVSNAKMNFQESDRVQWIENTDNRGFAAANNQVLENIDAEFAVLMNPDCELNDKTLSPILAAFDQHQNMGLASCTIFNEDGSIQTTCKRRFPTPLSSLSRMLFLEKIFPRNPRFANFDYGDLTEIRNGTDTSSGTEFIEAVSGAFMVVRKSALEDVGLLDEAYFMHCEDLDWCKRFALAGWQVGLVASSSVMHVKGVSTASRPIGVLWTLHLGMLRFFRKFYKKEHSWLLRTLVAIGIMGSFALRAGLSMLKSLLAKLGLK